MCGGMGFALSTYAPPSAGGGGGGGGGSDTYPETPGRGQDESGPAVLLLEVTFGNVTLCEGCVLAGSGPRGEFFRLRHKAGARLDFVGPTVGALECAPPPAAGGGGSGGAPAVRRLISG